MRVEYTRLLFFLFIIVVLNACDGSGSNDKGSDSDTIESNGIENNCSESVNQDKIIHNGLCYRTNTSPYTGKVWLDRNLGATRVCESYIDEQCFGDYYQWGRSADGHEKVNSDTTTTLANNINNVGHSKFIVSSYSNGYDWVDNIDEDGLERQSKWNDPSGNSICPAGYRVPTITELEYETTYQGVNSREDAFNSFLKLPASGTRYREKAYTGDYGQIWSSSIEGYNGSYTLMYATYPDDMYAIRNSHSWDSGIVVRCIQD